MTTQIIVKCENFTTKMINVKTLMKRKKKTIKNRKRRIIDRNEFYRCRIEIDCKNLEIKRIDF